MMVDEFIQQIKDNQVVVTINLDIYNQEVITSTVYKFSDKYFISQAKKENTIIVSFQAKLEQSVDFELLQKEFENELIDQQVRYDTEQKFDDIRNRIVEKAFSPINK